MSTIIKIAALLALVFFSPQLIRALSASVAEVGGMLGVIRTPEVVVTTLGLLFLIAFIAYTVLARKKAAKARREDNDKE